MQRRCICLVSFAEALHHLSWKIFYIQRKDTGSLRVSEGKCVLFLLFCHRRKCHLDYGLWPLRSKVDLGHIFSGFPSSCSQHISQCPILYRYIIYVGNMLVMIGYFPERATWSRPLKNGWKRILRCSGVQPRVGGGFPSKGKPTGKQSLLEIYLEHK